MIEPISASLDLIAQRASAVTQSAEARLSSAIVGIAGIVDDIVQKIRELLDNLLRSLRDSVGGWLSTIVGAIGGFLADVFNRVGDYFNLIATRIHDAIQAVANSVSQIASRVYDAIQAVASSIRDTITNLVNTLSSRLQSLVSAVENLASRLANAVISAISDLANRISDLANRLVNAVTESINRLMDRMAGLIGQIVESVRQAFSQLANQLIQAISNVIATVRDKIAELVQGVIQGVTDLANKVREGIQRFAEQVSQTVSTVVERVRTTLEQILTRIYETVQEVIRRVSQFTAQAIAWVNENVWKRITTAIDQLKETANHKINVLQRAMHGGYSDLAALIDDLADPAPGAAAIVLIPVLFILGQAFSMAVSVVLQEAFQGLAVTARRHFKQHYADPGSAARAALMKTGDAGAIEAAYSAAGLSASQFELLKAALMQIPDAGAIIAAMLKGDIGVGEAEALLERQGYIDGSLKIFLGAARQILAPGEILEALNRGLISIEQARSDLKARGYDDRAANVLLELRHVIPGVSDLIRFMVRDAFNEDVVRRYGYDEDFPEAILEWTRKQGLDDRWVRAYWRAHWQLPSPTQGFEMLHRGVISLDDLRTLLKIADYPPYWRDKLIQISYNPITRVDIRRMYRLGIFSFEDLVERYKHLGYTEEDARALAEFTAKYEQTDVENLLDRITTRTQNAIERAYAKGKIDRNTALQYLVRTGMAEDVARQVLAIVDFEREIALAGEEEPEFRTMARQDILDAYAIGMLTRDEAKHRLLIIGYADADADFLLNRVEYRRQLELRRERADIAVAKYVEGVIEESELIAQLTALGLTKDEIDIAVERAQLARQRKIKTLSEATLARLLRMGIIDEQTYAEELRKQGYSDRYIEWLLQSRITSAAGG